MMSGIPSTQSDPNPLVRRAYDELGDLLDRGDEVFVEEGPALLKEAVKQDGFFENVTTDPATPDEYTREKVIGDPGEHVIRFMEWPPEYTLMPHEHHGRPCFEVLVEGQLMLADLTRTTVGENAYVFDVRGSTIAGSGDSAVVDLRKGEIHSVYSPVRSKSLHVYPEDNWTAYGYVLKNERGTPNVYERQEFRIRNSTESS